MDFFSNVASADSGPPPTEPLDPFAQAIADRFGSGSPFTARLLPEKSPASNSFSSSHPATLPLPSTPMSKMSLASSTPASVSFTPVPPSSLRDVLKDHSNILILDIRPHAAFTSARIPRALSLCVPSTLLKRPLFSLEKLSAMLPSTASRDSFSAWRAASRIIVYDADSAAIPGGSNINGLLMKFKKEGFTGDLGWLQGGFQAVWRTQRDLITSDPPSPDTEPEDVAASPFIPGSAPPGVLRTRQLPMSAFSHSSTTTSSSKAPTLSRNGTFASLSLPPLRPAANPFFDAIRQNTELSHGITDRIPLRLPRRIRRRISDLPFRWLQDIARRSVVRPPTAAEYMDSDLSSGDESEDDIDPADVEEGTEALAMQFYRIELAEQRRLMGVMEHHSKESGPSDSQPTTAVNGSKPLKFPFSITAGVEKGAKNRYRHIWPFEHARVRLHQRRRSCGTASPEDDYVNASYVQPLGTTRRYIATQGPLPATFADFWTLCWEQNVHVIVMLTREMEGAVVKCENYWCSSSYGPIRLKLLSTSAATPSASTERSVAGMNFSLPPKRASATTIKRVFELTNTRFSGSKPRIVTHFQYLEWPDMNVPDDPRGILGLIKEVDAAIAASSPLAASDCTDICSTPVDDLVDSTTGVAQHALGKKSPVLLHCSAGVGRTGGFIAVDALLDAIRHELKKKLATAPNSGETLAKVNEKDAMDVDPPVVRTIPLELAASHKSNGKQREVHEEDRGFIVHLPNAGWGADSLKTPSHDRMVVDSHDEIETDTSPTDSPSPDSVPSNNLWLTDRPKPSTREWAEAVSDSTGMIGGGLRNPNANSSSSSITSSNASSNMNLSLPPPIVPIEAHAPGSRRKQSPAPTDSSSSIPSRHSSDSLGLGSIGADLPSSSVGTTMSNKSSQDRGLIRPSVPGGSQELLKGAVDFVKDQKVLTPSGLDSPRSSEVVPSTNNTSNTSSTVGQPRLEFSQSPQPLVARSGMDAVTASSKDLSTKSTSPSSLPPPSSSLSSVSRSASRSDFSREPIAQRRNFQSEPSGNPSGMGFRSVSPPISLLDGPHGVSASVKKSVTAKSHLADTFSSDDNLSSADDVQASIVDYKEPRPLHADRSPIALSKFEEPVWQIIHDMREQRMSLCQSLRQYVFVHAALIEGALMIVDEERELSENGSTLGSSTVNVDTEISAGANTNPGSEMGLMPSGGKRGASPTELLKKDRKGELSLAKRPSMKRKKSSTEGRTFDTTARSLLARSSAAALP